MFRKPQDSASLNTSYSSNFTNNNGKSKTPTNKNATPFSSEKNPFVHHNRRNLNSSSPAMVEASKLPPIDPSKKKKMMNREEDTISKATSQITLQPLRYDHYNRSVSNHSMLSGGTERTERSRKIFNTEMMKSKPKVVEKFTVDANPFVNSSRTKLNSAGSNNALNDSRKLDLSKRSQDEVVEKVSDWQVKNKEVFSDNESISKRPPSNSYSHIDAPFVVAPSNLNMSRSTVASPGPKSNIGFMMATPDPYQNRFSHYLKDKITRLNVLIFLFFLVILVLLLVSLVSPYWLVMKEPWVERLLIPKQFILEPNKTDAWIGLYSSCNTENQCSSGTPFDDKGWYNTCKVLFAVGFSLMCAAFVVECVYVCCMAYVLVPTYKLVLLSSLLILAGAIFCGVCLALYGASCLNNGILTPMSLNGPGGLLTWAFFLAIVATALAFVVALLFGIDAMIQSKKIRTNE